MLRFKSLTSRVVLLHIVAVAVVAIFLPLVLFWLLTSEVNHLHGDAMRDQAEVLGERLAVKPDGTITLNLPDSLKDLYSEAYGRYQMSETPPHWARPSVPLGYHKPVWPGPGAPPA